MIVLLLAAIACLLQAGPGQADCWSTLNCSVVRNGYDDDGFDKYCCNDQFCCKQHSSNRTACSGQCAGGDYCCTEGYCCKATDNSLNQEPNFEPFIFIPLNFVLIFSILWCCYRSRHPPQSYPAVAYQQGGPAYGQQPQVLLLAHSAPQVAVSGQQPPPIYSGSVTSGPQRTLLGS